MELSVYKRILTKHLRAVPPASLQVDDYGRVPSEAELRAMNAAMDEYLAQFGTNRLVCLSSVSDEDDTTAFDHLLRAI